MTPKERLLEIVQCEQRAKHLRDTCPHEEVEQKEYRIGGVLCKSDDATCIGCGKVMGSYCEESPNKMCERDNGKSFEYFGKYTSNCIYCKEPVSFGPCYYR